MDVYNGPERRGLAPMGDVQQSLIKLISKMDSVESNIGVRLDSMKDKLSSLEQNLDLKIDHLNKRLETHEDSEQELNTKLALHDSKFAKVPTYLSRLTDLEAGQGELSGSVEGLKLRVRELEDKPLKARAGVVTSVGAAMANAFYMALGGGAVAIVLYLLKLAYDGITAKGGGG